MKQYKDIKYVVFKKIRREFIVTFPSDLTHIELANSITKMSKYTEPISGGFIENGKCFGESISLDLKSRPEDTLLLNQMMYNEK